LNLTGTAGTGQGVAHGVFIGYKAGIGQNGIKQHIQAAALQKVPVKLIDVAQGRGFATAQLEVFALANDGFFSGYQAPIGLNGPTVGVQAGVDLGLEQDREKEQNCYV
jgi:hypothetical protein